MSWEFIVALIIAIPVILFPAAFAWYLNVGGVYAAIKKARRRRAERLAMARADLEKARQEGEHRLAG